MRLHMLPPHSVLLTFRTTHPANAPAGWWYKPDFIINDLNINSAIMAPAHDEVLPLATNEPYLMKGYAYSGGWLGGGRGEGTCAHA